MSKAAIEYIWKAIQESERSDEFQVMSDEMPIATPAHVAPQPQPDRSGVVSRDPIIAIALSPQLAAGDSVQAAALLVVPLP